MIRKTMLAGALILAGAMITAGASAAQTVVSISSEGEFSRSTLSSNFVAASSGLRGDVGTDHSMEYRYTFEFALPSLPSGAAVSSVGLGLREFAYRGDVGPLTVDLFGMAGDGASMLNDAVSGNFIRQISGSNDYTQFDVTPFILGLLNDGDGFASFSLRYSGSSSANFDSGAGSSAPHLYFNFTEAAAAPEPASWAMMLAGFGAIGATMRQRQRTSVTFARRNSAA